MRYIGYTLQQPFKEELERLQQQDIITLIGMDEKLECCNSFVLKPKPNGKVKLCIGPARLKQALIRPVHRGPTLNNIFQRLNNVKCLSLIDASFDYHNLKLDERSSYPTIFTCQVGRYKTRHSYLEQHLQVICFNEKLMRYLKIYQRC